MKKYIVYLFALSMSLAPIHNAYAFGITKGQLIKMGKQGGALVKSGSGKLLKMSAVGFGIQGASIATGAAIQWCKNNQKKCKDKIGDAYDVICDITGCDVEHKEDDESGQCIVRYGDKKQTLSDFISSISRTEERVGYKIQYYAKQKTTEQLKDSERYALNSANKNNTDWTFFHGYYTIYYTTTDNFSGQKSDGSTESSVSVYVKCGGNHDNKLSDDELDELAKIIVKNMDDDDIKNYYNYDYGDITINNNKYDGDEINKQTNIEKYCQNHSCNEISKDIEKDLNNNKYDVDDVNEKNCKMENSKYISCNVNKSDDDNDEDNTTNNTTNNTKKDSDDELYKCGTTDLTKKICNFLDWSKSDDYDDENDKLEIKEYDGDKPNTKVEFTGNCPAPYEINISLDFGFMGTINYDLMLLDTPKLCNFLDDWVEPIIYVLGPLHAIYILGGNRENV